MNPDDADGRPEFEDMSACCESAAPVRPKANADQEAWVQGRLRGFAALVATLVRQRSGSVAANEPMFAAALEGAIQGAAVELIHTLGMEPEYANLRRIPDDASIRSVLMGGTPIFGGLRGAIGKQP